MAVRKYSKIPAHLLHEEPVSKDKLVYAKWRLSCVRCLKVCNPNYYMVCKDKCHFLCGKCAWLAEPRPSHYLCCNPENLRKGPPGHLENLLDRSLWDCLYKENGCDETPTGLTWETHVEKCIYKCDLKCFYKACKGITHGVDETIKHYKENHMLTELGTEKSKIKLDLIYDRSADGIKRRLTLVKDGGGEGDDTKYYIVGTEVANQNFNIFIWDCSQKENYKKGETGRRYELVLLPFPGDKHNAIGQMTYNGMCQPMQKMPEEIVENADCLSIGRSQLLKKYLRAFPGCAELDLCNIVVTLETKGSPEPQPQLPAPGGVNRMSQSEEYERSLYPCFPPRDASLQYSLY